MAGDRQAERRDSTSPALPVFARLGEGGFHARLAASPGVSVVLFTAPQCGACRAWKQLLPEALADVAHAFYEIDVSGATGVARYFGIFHLPTIYLYRDGRFHAELQCQAAIPTIRDTAHGLLDEEAREEP